MKRGVTLTILFLFIFLINIAVVNSAKDALIFSRDDVGVFMHHYRFWNGTSYTAEQNVTSFTSSDTCMVEMAGSPGDSGEAAVIVVADNGPDTASVIIYNGTTWVNNLTLTATPDAVCDTPDIDRVVDIEYFNDTHAIAVWKDEANFISRYIIWDGTAWGSELFTINVSAPSGWKPFQQELGCDPNSNECILVQCTGTNSNDKAAYAQVWDGTAWGNNITILDGTTANTQCYRQGHGIDVEYDQDGNAMVLVGNMGLDRVQYIVWNGTSNTWGNIGDATTDLDHNPGFVELAVHPTTNEMALIVADFGRDAYVNIWNGTAWNASRKTSRDSSYMC